MTKLTVEHVMPQTWRGRWPAPAPSDDPLRPSDVARDIVLHSFGNLTLLTQKLNSKASNAPFTEKREEIVRQSALRLNSYFLDEEAWDEARIHERGRRLLATALKIWPCPRPARELIPTNQQSELLVEVVDAPSTPTGPMVLPDAIAAFKRLAPEEVEVVGGGKRFRQIRVPGWPDGVHYEFLGYTDVVGIDLHVELQEDDPFRPDVIAQLDALLPAVRAAFPGFECTLINKPRWRWLSVMIPLDAVPSEQLGAGMLRLIESTKPQFDEFFEATLRTAIA